jgi:hypothetical protein
MDAKWHSEHGTRWYEDQYLKTLGKLSDGPIGFNPWQDPNKKLTPVLEAALAKAYPGGAALIFADASCPAMIQQSAHRPVIHFE